MRIDRVKLIAEMARQDIRITELSEKAPFHAPRSAPPDAAAALPHPVHSALQTRSMCR